ncbi:hypothetical protein [Cerasicoccus frondis]|uniref:hypothetical protein n=1 Tax=Cerasicoccus frondis TaxID=490090 RepID=UPI002852A057|nr:hypothetical protein [Cerasicoccus frondis]
MTKTKKIAGVGLVSLPVIANAQVDYSTVTSGLTGEFAGILALGLGVAVAVVGLFAAPKGVKFAKRMWAAIAG